MRLLVLAATLACATPARAERYGGELLGSEAIGWGIAAGGAKFHVKPVLYSGAAIAVLTPPLIHLLLHDNPGGAGLSLGLRVGLPAVGALAGKLLDPCRGDDCLHVGPIAGAIAGYIAAIAIDTIVLAKQDDPAVMPAARLFVLRRAF